MVREICCRTAFRNRGAKAVFEDEKLFADYWSSYYTDYEPESCLVVEEEGRVIGYLFGCVDARRFERIMAKRIVPRIVGLVLWRVLSFQYRQPSTRRMIRWLILYSWREVPPIPLEKYPAHYHCNLLPEGHRKHYYSRMALRFLDRLDELGIERMHGQILEPVKGGLWKRMAVDYGQPELVEHEAETSSSLYRVVFQKSKPMVNRVWGIRAPDYREWLHWMAREFGL